MLLTQVMHMIWHSASPVLYVMVRYMFSTIGEPPPDVGARVLVSAGNMAFFLENQLIVLTALGVRLREGLELYLTFGM